MSPPTLKRQDATLQWHTPASEVASAADQLDRFAEQLDEVIDMLVALGLHVGAEGFYPPDDPSSTSPQPKDATLCCPPPTPTVQEAAPLSPSDPSSSMVQLATPTSSGTPPPAT